MDSFVVAVAVVVVTASSTNLYVQLIWFNGCLATGNWLALHSIFGIWKSSMRVGQVGNLTRHINCCISCCHCASFDAKLSHCGANRADILRAFKIIDARFPLLHTHTHTLKPKETGKLVNYFFLFILRMQRLMPDSLDGCKAAVFFPPL